MSGDSEAVAGREEETVEQDDKETVRTTNLAYQVFKNALYRWAKVLKDAGEPLPMAIDKC